MLPGHNAVTSTPLVPFRTLNDMKDVVTNFTCKEGGEPDVR